MFEKIKNIICEQFAVDEDYVTPDTNLVDDLGADSLKYFSVLSADEEKFSDKIKKYVHEYVKPEYHRVFSSFMNYDALSERLKEDNTPTLTYTKIDGEKVRLCVYPDLLSNNPKASVWVFESEGFFESRVNGFLPSAFFLGSYLKQCQ